MTEPKWQVLEKASTSNVRMVGIEAEGLLFNSKDEVVVPPAYWERDGFPVLVEVQGDPGSNPAEAYSNFMKKKMEIEELPKKGNRIAYTNIARVRLKTYKEAMKQVTEAKGEMIGRTRNIYGINVEDFSDQVLKGGKIQGVNASCGLHIHFSLSQVSEMVVEEPKFELIRIPVETIPLSAVKGETKGLDPVMKHLTKPVLSLYTYEGRKEKKKLRAEVSALNRPTIEWMVKSLDEELFKEFAPPKDERTKYRQAGFYELKPHGFEYRSLPANEQTLAELPNILAYAFELLDRVNSFE